MAVTRCVCFRRRFGELLAVARGQGIDSLERLSALTGCGTGCGGCRPYLAAMLATGATCFAVREAGREPVACTPEAWEPV